MSCIVRARAITSPIWRSTHLADGLISCKHAKKQSDTSKLEDFNDDAASIYTTNISSTSSLKSFARTATSEAEVGAKRSHSMFNVGGCLGTATEGYPGDVGFRLDLWPCNSVCGSFNVSIFGQHHEQILLWPRREFLHSYRSMKEAFDETNATGLAN